MPREHRAPTPDNMELPSAISPGSVVSDLKVSGQDIAPEGREHQDNGDNGNWMLEWPDRANNKALSVIKFIDDGVRI